MHESEVASLCVISAIVAGIIFFFVGLLTGRSDHAPAEDAPNNASKRLEWLESNVGELWQHVNELEDQIEDDTRAGDYWKKGAPPTWNPDDTEIEGE